MQIVKCRHWLISGLDPRLLFCGALTTSLFDRNPQIPVSSIAQTKVFFFFFPEQSTPTCHISLTFSCLINVLQAQLPKHHCWPEFWKYAAFTGLAEPIRKMFVDIYQRLQCRGCSSVTDNFGHLDDYRCPVFVLLRQMWLNPAEI